MRSCFGILLLFIYYYYIEKIIKEILNNKTDIVILTQVRYFSFHITSFCYLTPHKPITERITQVDANRIPNIANCTNNNISKDLMNKANGFAFYRADPLHYYCWYSELFCFLD